MIPRMNLFMIVVLLDERLLSNGQPLITMTKKPLCLSSPCNAFLVTSSLWPSILALALVLWHMSHSPSHSVCCLSASLW